MNSFDTIKSILLVAAMPVEGQTRRRKKLIDEDANEDNMSKMEESPSINLPAASKKKLLKIDLENKMERK
ncbi:hypothetical protein AVEN_245226-1, partial [Araneus ventricosus]